MVMASAVPHPPAPMIAIAFMTVGALYERPGGQYLKLRAVALRSAARPYNTYSLSFSYTAPEGFNVLLKRKTRSTANAPKSYSSYFPAAETNDESMRVSLARASVICGR